MLPDVNEVEAIEDYIIADPTVVANADFPGEGKSGGGTNHYSFPDVSTKQAQEKTAGRMG
jgi:hypothetical protein